MELGTFSVSLTVKNLEKSKQFYEKLGFSIFGGDASQGWLIMRNNNTTIGLFHGMFEKNLITFNPGWDQDCNTLNEFQDVREIQHKLTEQGIKLISETDGSTTGPANIIIEDPDGNQILIDQHV